MLTMIHFYHIVNQGLTGKIDAVMNYLKNFLESNAL